MKNRILFVAVMAFSVLSCKNDIPVAPVAPTVPTEKPKKNDLPNPPTAPEKPTLGSNTSVG